MSVAMVITCNVLKHLGYSGFLIWLHIPAAYHACHLGKIKEKQLMKKALSPIVWRTFSLPSSGSSLRLGMNIFHLYRGRRQEATIRSEASSAGRLGSGFCFRWRWAGGCSLKNAVLSSIPHDTRRNNKLQKLLIYYLEICHPT